MENTETILRVLGAILTLGSAIALVVLGRTIGSTRLNKILYALIGFFSLFALLRLLSGFVEVFYSLLIANALFLLLDVVLIAQTIRLKRSAPTDELKKERVGVIDEAIDLVLGIEKDISK